MIEVADLNKTKGLRVLLRASYPPPYGGIASLVVSLLPGIAAMGAEDVAVLMYGSQDKVKRINGAIIYTYALKKHLWRLFLPKNWRTTRLVFTTFKPFKLSFKEVLIEAMKTIFVDQIASKHASNVVAFYQSDNALELLACRKKWGASRGIALTVFGEIYDNSIFLKSNQALFRALIEAPDAVLATSAHCAQSFKEIDSIRPIKVIYVGISLARFAQSDVLRAQHRATLNIATDTPVLLFMGRFDSEMGLDSLIELIPDLIKDNDQLKIILAGAKGQLCEPAQACQSAYPDHVMVMNDVSFDLQPLLYATADIVLAPSRDKRACMGVTIKEAMAAERPVIATNSGGIAEAVIHDETGVIVPLNPLGALDKAEFKQAIQQLLNDKARCLEMAKKAKLRAAEVFSEEVTVRRTAEVFLECMPND